MTSIIPQPGIMEIAVYQGGASYVPGVEKVIKLSSNENPYGPSPRALDAFRAAAAQLHIYPSTDHAALRAAIAETHGLDAERIICGAGSDEIIAFLCQAFAGPGDEVLYTEHGFGMYRISALAAGATPVKAPESERRIDIDKLLAATTPKTRLVFIANPANPTGTMLSDDELAAIADGLPPQALLVLDGAYAEFAPGYDGGAGLIETRENVVMTRTFSKIYGLGGMRVGWGYGPAFIIDVLNRIRGPFNLSGPALAAAEAAVRDQDYASWCRDANIREREKMAAALADIGLMSDPSHANFILLRFADTETAQGCDAFLKSRGLIVRTVAGYGFPDCLRITIGDSGACAAVVTAITDYMGRA